MARFLPLLTVLVMFAPASWGTIIVAVGTKDGLLLCEDRRVTITSSTGKVASTDADKAQQLGKFGFFAISGDVSGGRITFFGQPMVTFDVRAEIPAFFQTHNIQQFDEAMAREFDAHLWDELKKKAVHAALQNQDLRAQTEVLLYWMDQDGQPHLYVLNLAANFLAGDGTTAPQTTATRPPVGAFIPLNLFQTSKPLVRGKGVLGYNALTTGTDPAFDDIRQDEELQPFLRHPVEAASLDSIAATRSIKKLIRLISQRQHALNPGGLDVGQESDCFLGTQNGIENINQ